MSENTNTREKKPNLQPGDLNQYIHLTTVSIWLVLGAFLVFVIGMVVWGFFGRLTVSVQAVAVSQESSIMLYIPEDQVSRIKQDSELVINDTTAAIGEIRENAYTEKASDALDEYQRSLADLTEDQKVLVINRTMAVPDGSYSASIILERIKPFSFLFGGKK
ncbi:MAG: hypothetical protein J5599_05260 [Spirochaetales bacterium]|nr:hypothetical protein [Spirochaetales bacterium]MBR5098005.1 hypothetical protein [Spirochaetales bacterium]